MEVHTIEFLRLQDCNLHQCMNAVGVFSLWDGKARTRPTFIGKGVVLERLAKEARELYAPFDGTVGIVGDGSLVAHERISELIRSVLLVLSEDKDRYPTRNKTLGHVGKIFRTGEKNGVLRINIRGRDPLLSPDSRPLARGKTIETRFEEDDDSFCFRIDGGDWKARRIR